MGRALFVLTEQAMTIFAETAADPNISNAARWTGRALSGVVVLFLMFDGAMKLLPLQVVTETMDKMGYGASDNLARSLGLITIVCTVLYAVPPTSILGAILLTGTWAARSHPMCGSTARCSRTRCSASISA
jgi:hypothetical protein